MTMVADFLPLEFSLTQTNQKYLGIARATLSEYYSAAHKHFHSREMHLLGDLFIKVLII